MCQMTSKRFLNIIKFLQEAARIVPMESLVFAIAGHKSATTAQRCTQAVLSAATSSSIPVSKLMAHSFIEACSHLYRDPFPHHLIDISPYHANMHLEDANDEHYYLDHDEHYYFDEHYYLDEGYYLQINPEIYYHESFPPITPATHGPFVVTQQKYFSSVSTHLSIETLLHTSQHFFRSLAEAVKTEARRLEKLKALNLISGCNVGEIYPISNTFSTSSRSGIPIPSLQQILRKARHDLASLAKSHSNPRLSTAATDNCMMLEKVNHIIKNDLDPCVAMLGGFMEQQIRVPLVNNPFDTAKAFDSSSAVGVWALFALDNKEIANIVKSRENRNLIIQVADFIKGVLRYTSQFELEASTSYNAKLQFLLQGMSRTVTCSNQYISYSLERELVAICAERNITISTKVEYIVSDWDNLFYETALVLVPVSHRPLLARWLIWALNIYQLREGLASYTTVGVIGLVNSGKSTFVNKIFGRKVSHILLYTVLYINRQYKVLHNLLVLQYHLFIIWMIV